MWISVFSSINVNIIFYIIIANGPLYIKLNICHLKFKLISIFIEEKTLNHILFL